MGWENELHKLPLLPPEQGFEPELPKKSQQHALANRLWHPPELPNQLFTLIEAWPTLGIQPGARGAWSSQRPSQLRAGCRSGYAGRTL